MELPCLACKSGVHPDSAKVFAGVFLCPTCFIIAEKLYARGKDELNMMLLVLKESIRLAALKGELQFMSGSLEDVAKADLISHLARLASEAQQQSVPRSLSWPTTAPTRSPAPTPPSAHPVGGKRSTS